MKSHVVMLSVLLALAVAAPIVNGNLLIFTAKLAPVGGPAVAGSGTAWIQYDYDNDVEWQVNVTDVVGLSQLQIVDGNGDGSVEGVTLKTLNPPVSGTQNLGGSYAVTDINPAVAANMDELAGHICMGHIYVSAKMESGQMLMGKLVYTAEEGSTFTCDEAFAETHGGDHMETTPPSPSSSVIVSAASRSIVAMILIAAMGFFF